MSKTPIPNPSPGKSAKPPSGQPNFGDTAAFELVHAQILRFFPDLVAELDGDPLYLLHQMGIDPDVLVAGGRSTTYRQLANLLEFASAELGCPDFGMRLAEYQKGSGVYGPLGLVMQSSTTFGEALHYVCKHNYAHSLAARVSLKRMPAEGRVFVGHDILLDRIPNKSQVMEQVLLLGHLGALEMTGGKARARGIHFRHQPVSALTRYRHYFGCKVWFDQDEDGLVFSEQDLATPILTPDARALEEMIAFIDREFTRRTPPMHAMARGVIVRLLGSGDCSNQCVAAELNVHLRTLHRRLRAEGTSFQQVKDEVRRDIMLYYLQQTDFEFSRIAQRLGFAEQSVMSRMCMSWFSASPTEVRLRRAH
jgi:AraC-like DNA-binding protein